ncbi:PhzF family phenazine biosynthesis protein [Cellulomonas endophytica]|uniref:PhzF family phenazine biosynthesis protein n=1 Tax=Cellulomonas endophytica TaxID=2494735 RepID=UPI001F0C7555|nr:PhzF family phenazine biosynthesis protein [Cellulomonas endophytica]
MTTTTDLDEVLRLAAFTTDPAGGNPAGVVLDATGWGEARMQEVATAVDYAETAFVVRPPQTVDGERRLAIRYFSPVAEVPFCGHATVATAVALAERDGTGPLLFETPVGPVRLETEASPDGVVASFTSVEPRVDEVPAAALDAVLQVLSLSHEDLDPALPPRLAFAGNTHPVLALADAAVFDGFVVDPAPLRALMDEQGWRGTVTVVHRTGPTTFEARNPFPVGRIVEDPATGSAAAALGAYLRAEGLVEPPARVTVHQGRHVGRPGLLTVDIPPTGGIVVRGTARPIVP